MSPIPLGILAASGVSAGSFDLLETSFVSTTTASVTFSNLNNYDYKHLQIRLTGRTNRADYQDRIAIRYNGVSSSTYVSHVLQGTGSSAQSAYQDNFQFIYTTGSNGFNLFSASEISNYFGSAIIDILDFKNSNTTKTLRMFSGIAGGTQSKFVIFSSGFNTTTDAINSITLLPQFGSWVSGTRISIYGIKG
jgi:hypothetical protein